MTARALPAVALVGAGPGDRDLVTLRAEAVLAAADVVVADPTVAALARQLAPRAELVEVEPCHGPDLVALAATAGTLARCYAGDAWLHPDHADDAARLASAGVAHETVPAVAAEWGPLAAAGIPVHHRPRAVTVTVGPLVDLPPPVDPARTLVATVDDLRAAAGHLAAAGDPTMPAAVVPATATGPTAAPALAPTPRRGTLADLAATAPRVPGVVVTGAVTVAGPDATTPAGAADPAPSVADVIAP